MKSAPLRRHVEEVHEKVIGEGLRPIGKDAVWRAAKVRLKYTQAAEEHCHFGSGEAQQLRLIDQQGLGGKSVVGLEVIAEAVGERLQHGEGGSIGLLLGGIHASRR